MAKKTYRLGVDVGGTNTDAVLLDVSSASANDHGVAASFKTPTTSNVTKCITSAVQGVLESSSIARQDIECAVIGTTSFINAVLEQDARRLSKVAILRLSKSFLRQIPPFSDWPKGLRSICEGYLGYVDGGLAIDGSQESPLNEKQVLEHCAEIRRLGIKSVVVAGVFSPIDEFWHQEDRVQEIVSKELPGVDVVCSHKVANIGFKERENACILNAAILKYARRTVREFRSAIKGLDLSCPLYLTQNDGTVVDCNTAAEYPLRTFSSGPTNSMRGAAYLSGMRSMDSGPTIVVDIGGTTSDVGVLEKGGLPRQAPAYVSVADITVNYSMPLLHSIGLGGGSLVRQDGQTITVGPDSVGHELVKEALVFGGSVLTTTDIVVSAGAADVGDKAKVSSLDSSFIAGARERISVLLENAIDRVKTSPDPIKVILVGGGSIVAPESLKGASELIRPPFHDVANAVGAAIATVGGLVDIVQNTANQTVQQATEHAKTLAIERARRAGAKPESISVVEIESMPLQYVTNQIRTIVKAIGDLDVSNIAQDTNNLESQDLVDNVNTDAEAQKSKEDKVRDEAKVDPTTYRPLITKNIITGIQEWQISETDLEYMSRGMYVLGCAGGGNPESTRIMLRDQLRAGHSMRAIDCSSLKESDIIYWGGHMGSPAVSVERLASTETIDAIGVLMDYLRHDSFDAVMGLEIGGANGLEPFLVGSTKYYDRPVIDADWMGRAYPTYWQTTLAAHKPGELVPCAIDSGDGKSILMTKTSNDEIVDRALRASCSEMGSRVGMAAKPTKTEYVQKYGVINTCSLAWRIGRCIAIAQQNNTVSTVAESIIEETGGKGAAKILFRGKITAVERRLYKGHSLGEITISATSDDIEENIPGRMEAVAQGGSLMIPFKNENILAEHTTEAKEKRVIATVPDLISVLDAGTGYALGVPEYKYGLQVVVIGITCSPRWTSTPLGLEIGGPSAFGFDVPYQPLGTFVEPRSVILEYASAP
ncbi:putative hydantoinase [Phaeomoniella chlamydospora]|uniref:Putative hydantoinase n=1 Tax=Phaeomoniella chlamydospora TaxID=158046 RepID=A0A0G2DZG4_PHACM|nr:putative hydantoinase [Phaeomoniella chlamydospora]